MTGPIELYYWPTPNGWKISIALEEMGLPYTLHLVNIGAGDQFDPDLGKPRLESPDDRFEDRSEFFLGIGRGKADACEIGDAVIDE